MVSWPFTEVVPRLEMMSQSNSEKRKKKGPFLSEGPITSCVRLTHTPHYVTAFSEENCGWQGKQEVMEEPRGKSFFYRVSETDGERTSKENFSMWNFYLDPLFLWILDSLVTALAIDGEMNNHLSPRLCLWWWQWQQTANHFYGRICVCVRHFSNWIRKRGLPYICLHGRAPANAFPVLSLGWWIE